MNEQPQLRRRRTVTTSDLARYEASSTYRRARDRETWDAFKWVCLGMFVFGLLCAVLIALGGPIGS
jgi:hypothetical protein